MWFLNTCNEWFIVESLTNILLVKKSDFLKKERRQVVVQ
jgi:hypothetical protein